MFIDDIHKFIQFLSKKQRGFFATGDDIDNCINRASMDLFKQRFGLPEDYQAGRPIPRVAYEITQKVVDDLKNFKVTVNLAVSSGRVTYPLDYVHVSKIGTQATLISGSGPTAARTGFDIKPMGFTFFDTTTNIVYVKYTDKKADWITVMPTKLEEVDDSRWYDRLQRITAGPSFYVPICNFQSSSIEVSPPSLPNVILTYLKLPAKAKWGYTLTGSRQTFAVTGGVNGASVDIDWPEVTHNDIISRACSFLGIFIEDADLLQYSEIKKAKGE